MTSTNEMGQTDDLNKAVGLRQVSNLRSLEVCGRDLRTTIYPKANQYNDDNHDDEVQIQIQIVYCNHT